jgi:putative peptide zinc metalloprotease protein
VSIPWRKRPDLQITPPQQGGQSWGVKDPVTLSYYELRDEEYFVMSQLDLPVEAVDLCAAFGERFRPQILEPEELSRFLGQLIQQGLLVSQQLGYGRLLAAKCENSMKAKRWSKISNLLAIRFRGFDPDKFLGWLAERCGWLFSPWFLTSAGMLIVSAVVLVIVQFDQLIARLPEARSWLSAQNLVLMACILACVKVLHEIGHGLACKRFGGECHEMGLMLLVFTPCLYCNVSDIWMLSSKWQRMAVSAAGIGIEATIAAACTFLWWFSEPGLFHSVCLNMMIVCSVSTIIFNGNPLLRYDGYFILSDWLEIPNLYPQSVAAVQTRLANWYFGLNIPLSRPLSMQQEWGLIAYGVISAAYRTFLTLSIMWALYYWLKPHGLVPFVQIFGAITIMLMFGIPIVNLFRWVKAPDQRANIDWAQFRFKAGLTLLALSSIIFVPLPMRVSTTAILESENAARVYVTAEGTLVDSVKSGSKVDLKQQLAKLVDPRLERELARLEGEVAEYRVRLDQLERRRINEPGVSTQIPVVREALHDLEQQFKRRSQDAERLVLRAPRAGIVMPIQQQSRSQPGSLPYWSATPLDERNRGCFLRAGTTVCLVGDPSQLEATLVINQADFPLIRSGQSVRIRLVEAPGQTLTGEVIELAGLDIDLLSGSLIRRANLPTRITSSGMIKPVGTWYQARVRLLTPPDSLLPGTVGHAKIIVDPQSLFTGFRRWLGRTFG